MNKYLEVLSKNFTPENVLLILFGTILYFVLEFKTRKDTQGFNAVTWLLDNWYNLVINLVAIAAYFILVDKVGKLESFTIGLAPNYILDRLVAMSQKYTANK